jgi:hypothetical protein
LPLDDSIACAPGGRRARLCNDLRDARSPASIGSAACRRSAAGSRATATNESRAGSPATDIANQNRRPAGPAQARPDIVMMRLGTTYTAGGVSFTVSEHF